MTMIEEVTRRMSAVQTYTSPSLLEPICVAKAISETFQAIVEDSEAIKARIERNATMRCLGAVVQLQDVAPTLIYNPSRSRGERKAGFHCDFRGALERTNIAS
jgi:hypothetical protein